MRRDAEPGELGEARDALAIVRVDAGAKLLGKLRMKAVRASFGEVTLDLLANLGGHRRAHLERGKRRPQVEAGPTDDDRPPAFAKERVDLGVRQIGEPARRELLGGARDPDESMLE